MDPLTLVEGSEATWEARYVGGNGTCARSGEAALAPPAVSQELSPPNPSLNGSLKANADPPCGAKPRQVRYPLGKRKGGRNRDRQEKWPRESLLEENRRLMEMNCKLREVDAFKSEFLSMASHELRTPLTIIKEFVGILRDGLLGPLNPEQREYLDSAFQNCDRLSDLIDDLLDLQKIESGRMELKRRRVPLARILERCHRDFLPRFGAKSQALMIENSPDSLDVLCDEAKIIQVVVNLVGNAHKFTPEGGNVVIRSFRKGSEAFVEIEDDGPGIPESDLKKVFENFIQLGREDRPGAKGTGLGLPIAKKIVELHGGRIEARSGIGRGSTFCFSLPIHRQEEELRVLLEDRIKEATVQDRKLHFILLRLDPEAEERGRCPEAASGILSRIASVASRHCLRKDDEVRAIPSEGLLAIFAETDASGAKAILLRTLIHLRDETDVRVPLLYSSIQIAGDAPPEHWIALAKSRLDRVDVDIYGRSIILVRSNPEGLEDIQRTLTGALEGVQVLATTRGCDAFLLLGKIAPDLIVLDMEPPACDGRKILAHLQKIPNLSRLPKVIVVADKGLEEIRALGADMCLTRPLDVDLLTREVKRLLGKGAGLSENPHRSPNRSGD